MASMRATIEGLNQVETFARDITGALLRAKDETLREFAARVRRDAIRNIQLGATESQYPQSGNLADSIEYDVRDDSVSFNVGGPDTPYAAIQDQEGTTLIVPTGGKTLNFFWFRVGQYRAMRQVYRKGNQFFGRAWTSNIAVLEKIFAEKVQEADQGNFSGTSKGRVYYSKRNAAGRFTRRF